MSTSKFKKTLSLVLAIVMLFTMVPAAVFASEESYPVMKAYISVTGDYHDFKSQVVTVTFLDKIDYDAINGAFKSWDVSANTGSKEVMAWMYKNIEESNVAGADRYDVYIAGEGGVGANERSSDIFWNFTALKTVNGLEHFKTGNVKIFDFMFQNCFALEGLDLSSFDTSNVTSFKLMFTDCRSLKSINLANWDTSNATTMSSMFKNCYKLEELDISSFNTKKVTNMFQMFYSCESLKTLYIGDDWSVEQVSDGEQMFNCCYAVVGGVDKYKEDFQYIPPGIEYAKLKEEGGFLTYKAPVKEYKVTYEFKGEVPVGVSAPEEFKYNAGSKVDVADIPSVDGYTFSGWSTDDAQVQDGSFTINNDVHFVGIWTKINYYDVTYKFIGDTPDGVTTPEKVTYEEGYEVFVESEPYVNGYIFSGWSTGDADIASGKFNIYNNVEIVGTWSKLYNVKYEYIGVVPENATELPKPTSYEAGATVDVANSATAEGYTFSGWSTDDAQVQDGSFTMPKKDVVLYGSFKKNVTGIEASKDKYELEIGESDKIIITVTPDDADEKGLTYESSDESVVTVDENGNIKAVGEGTATITVTSKDDSSITETVKVTVKLPKVPVSGVVVETKEYTLKPDDTAEIKATVTPDNATNKELTYESSDESVVTVDENGNIKAVGEGEAIITVTSKDDSSITETVKVTVKLPKVPVSGVIVETKEYTLKPDDTAKITATVTPDNATNKELTYESSDESVVTVDEKGNIKAVGEGEAIITVTSKDDNSITETVKVTVKLPKVPVSGVVVETKEYTLKPDDTAKITATVTPDNATNKELTYESSDESVVTVDENGNIKAVGEGEAIITVTSKDDNSITETVKVTVKLPKVPVSGVVVETKEYTLKPDDTAEIKATVTPDNATNKELTYESSDESVVTVDENGNIKAVGEGTATITVTSKDDNSITETVKVTVKSEPVTEPEIPEIPEEPKYTIVAPESVEVYEDATINLGVKVEPAEGAPAIKYTSADESIVKVDANGNVTGIAIGETTITAELPNGEIAVILVVVTSAYEFSHYIVFGKTEKIGWYSVSMDGGETFMTVFGNSNLEVPEGTELIIRANDVFGDPFKFFINGKATYPDENGYVKVTVDGYMLIGALGTPVEAPDTEESLNLIQRIIKAIKDFFAMLFGRK